MHGTKKVNNGQRDLKRNHLTPEEGSCIERYGRYMIQKGDKMILWVVNKAVEGVWEHREAGR